MLRNKRFGLEIYVKIEINRMRIQRQILFITYLSIDTTYLLAIHYLYIYSKTSCYSIYFKVVFSY